MASNNLVIGVIFSILCVCLAEDLHSNSDKSEFKKPLTKNCDDSYSLTCLKINAISLMDKLNENDDISVMPGVSLMRENNSVQDKTGTMVAEVAREFPDDPNARLNAFLMKKIYGFLSNHSLKLNLWNSAEADTAGTARKDKKGDGNMGMILGVAAMMKGAMITLALGGLAAIAGKALMTSLISFMLSAIVGLKGLSSGGGGHSTYEVIAKPSHGGWDRGYEGYGRSLGSYPLPLALKHKNS